MQKNRHQLALTGFLAIFISALVITAAAAFAGWQIKKDGFRITARFNFLGNLMEGAPVLIAGGIQVGKVEEIYQENLHTRLTLYLDSSLEGKIPNNSNTRVSVFTNNLLGEKYISLVPGEVQPGDRFLQEGDEIRGIDPPSVDQMMLGFSRFFGASDGTDVLKDILSGLKQLNANINIIMYENKDDVAKIIELTDSSIGGLQSQFKNLNSEIATIRQNYVEATKNENVSISMISKNFGDIAGHMDSLKIILDTGQGSIMKLLRDKKLRENTEDASRYAKDFLKCINNQPWVLIYKESCN